MPELITKATPEQTPNSSVIKETTAFFNRSKIPPPVRLTQYDNLPFIAVRLVEGDEYYTVPVGAAVNIRMKKPDGTIVYNPAFGLSADRHTAYIETTTQMTVCPGHVSPILEVVVNSEQAGTACLHFEIERNPVQEDDIESTDEGKTITQLVQAAQDAADAASASEEAAADSAKDAQGAKTDAETAAEQANTAKTKAQTAAEQANTAKTEAQTAAVQANTAKTEAQTAATNAENSADAAADSAQQAAIESQKALGFRSYYGGQVVPDTNGDLDPSRPMSTPTAASVTIKARGDRIAGLTMAGKTTQEGTGDPSPDNIRMIDGIGMYDKMLVLDGSSDENLIIRTGASGYGTFKNVLDPKQSVPTAACCSYLKKVMTIANSSDFGFSISDAYQDIVFRISGVPATDGAYRAYLKAHPLIIWYRSVDFYKCKGPFYSVVELSQDPYRAVGFELNQPLFDGDSLKVGGKSGCDQMVMLDGTENWGHDDSYTYHVNLIDAQVAAVGSDKIQYSSSKYLWSANHPNASNRFNVPEGSAILYIIDKDADDLPAFKQQLSDWASAGTPLTIFYRSVNYTEENDIPVALESHQFKNVLFTGTEDWTLSGGDGLARLVISNAKADSTAATKDECSHYNFGAVGSITQPYAAAWSNVTAKQLLLNGEFENAQAAKDYIATQYSAGTPVQVVYELATPATYARPVPTMIAQPGEDGTFTVTGENSLSVLLKAFQDGGDAATLNGKKWQVFKIDVPASAWTGSGTNYTAAITLSGMTAALNVVACALGSNYVGTDAAEQAMAQWDYLETGANTVTFHAAVKPTANFGVVLTTVS